MKTFRLLAASLLVALSMGFISCESNEIVENSGLIDSGTKYLAKYGIDPSAYEVFSLGGNIYGQLIALGLKNNHIWMASYDTLSYKQLCEINDTEVTPKTITKYLGYGENVTLPLLRTQINGLVQTENGFVGQLNLIYAKDIVDTNAEIQKTTFFNDGKSLKKTVSVVDDKQIYTHIYKWYKDAVMLDNAENYICCKDNGDTLYTTYFLDLKDKDFVTVSYTDMVVLGLAPYRVDVSKEHGKIWNTKVTPPFDIPNDTKYSINVLENDSNIWKCKADFLYYDGTKKDYTFYLNIDNGTVSKTLNTSPLIGKWLYTTEEGNKEIITFYADNTGSWKSIDIYDNTSNTDPFTYTVDDKEAKFIIDFGDDSPETYHYEIANNKMKLIYEDGHTEVYTKQ